MIDYASTAQEILETPPRPPDWVRQRIEESDVLRNALEDINLREANEQEAINKHNRYNPADQRRFVRRKVPALLRLKVAHLAEELEVSKQVPYFSIPLLNLIYDEIQEALFDRGGYRQAWVREEENKLP